MRIYTTTNHYVVANPDNVRDLDSDPEIIAGEGKVVLHGFDDCDYRLFVSDHDRFLHEDVTATPLTEAEAIEYLQTGKIKKLRQK